MKLLVDEEEATPEEVWRQRLRARLEEASKIMGRYTSVRFEVIGFERWSSDNRLVDFTETLKEFESEVDRGAAQVAIGFTSQYQLTAGRDQLGGTRGALHSHILLREGNPKVFEPDRLEVLVHELGHFLGAAHSGDTDSVMRPVVADGRARAKAYQIHFDSENAEIIRLVGREMSDRQVKRFQDMTPVTLAALYTQYERIHRSFPEDPAASRYVKLLNAARRQPAALPQVRRNEVPRLPLPSRDQR